MLTNCGLKIKYVYNLRINNAYVRHGALDLQKLFMIEDCTDIVKDWSVNVPQLVAGIRSVTAADAEPAPGDRPLV